MMKASAHGDGGWRLVQRWARERLLLLYMDNNHAWRLGVQKEEVMHNPSIYAWSPAVLH